MRASVRAPMAGGRLAEGGAGAMTLVAAISNQQPAQPRFGFRAKGMTGTIDYLVYIETD